jgi:hypothetical protein
VETAASEIAPPQPARASMTGPIKIIGSARAFRTQE